MILSLALKDNVTFLARVGWRMMPPVCSCFWCPPPGPLTEYLPTVVIWCVHNLKSIVSIQHTQQMNYLVQFTMLLTWPTCINRCWCSSVPSLLWFCWTQSGWHFTLQETLTPFHSWGNSNNQSPWNNILQCGCILMLERLCRHRQQV